MADLSPSGPPPPGTIQPPTQPSTRVWFRRKGKDLVPASTSYYGAQSFEALDGDIDKKIPHRKDIYHTIFLLRQLTLPEIVPYILDEAEIWHTDRTFFYIDPNHGWLDIEGGNKPNDRTPILHYGPFTNIDLKCIRGVKFTVGCQRGVPSGKTWFEASSTIEAEGQDADLATRSERKKYQKRIKVARLQRFAFELDQNDMEFRVLEKSWSFQVDDSNAMRRLAGIKVGDYVHLTGHASTVGQPAALRVRYARIEVFYHMFR